MPRPIKAIINPGAVAHNLTVLKAKNNGAQCMAVVKANAYGHGLANLVAGFEGADALALLEIDQAVWLRQSGWTKPILLLEGCFDQADLDTAVGFKLDIAVHRASQWALVKQTYAGLMPAYKPTLYIKFNTGMNRLGFALEHAAELIDEINDWASTNGFPDPVLMTHYANADLVDADRSALPPLRQYQIAQSLNRHGWPTSYGNSAAALNWPSLCGQIFRPGISVYGASPGPRAAGELGLKPAMTLQSQVIDIQRLNAGQAVGYGSRWRAQRSSTIAVVACGYADGYPRHAPDGTPVQVAGQLCPLVGRVSMDMLTVDVTEVQEVKIGSEVELWGEHVSVDDVARWSGTIGYELLCAVAPRVPFVVVDF